MAEQLLQLLKALLEAEPEARRQAEAQLGEAARAQGYALSLTQIAASGDTGIVPYGARQLAAVLLKQHVKAHWVEGARHFEPPVVAEAEKQAIRQALPQGLADPSSLVRGRRIYYWVMHGAGSEWVGLPRGATRCSTLTSFL